MSNRIRSRVSIVDAVISEPTHDINEYDDLEDEDAIKAREREEIYKKGFEDGKREGIRIGRSEIGQYLQNLQQAADELIYAKQTFFANIEPAVLKLICEIAKKVILTEVKTDRIVMINMIKRALSKLSQSNKLSIRMNPEDLRFLEQLKRDNDLDVSPNDIDNLEFIEDGKIAVGGFIVESDTGIVDGRLESQFEELETSLLEGTDIVSTGT